MFTVQCTLPEVLADEIEAILCENCRSPWSLLQEKPSEDFILTGFFDDEDAAREAYAELRAECSALPDTPEYGSIEDREWKEAYKAHLHPWSHQGLHWVPSWRRDDYTVPPGEAVIYLDAGLAFGTGCHETTRLMARRLLDFKQAHGPEAFSSSTIIDAGCGTGILALSAVKLGATQVMGFDRDPEAYRVSVENRAFNHIPPEAATFRECGIEEGFENQTADLILANIQADVLKIHADSFIQATRPGGTLALSGILAREIDDVRALFEPAATAAWGNSTRTDSRADGDWADLTLFRQGK